MVPSIEGEFARNAPWFVLCDPRARTLYPDYDKVARETVGLVRGTFARRPLDASFLALVAALSARSPVFVPLWAEQHVSDKATGRKRFLHPRAGLLDLQVHALVAPDTADQSLIFYTPRDAATRAGLVELVPRPKR